MVQHQLLRLAAAVLAAAMGGAAKETAKVPAGFTPRPSVGGRPERRLVQPNTFQRHHAGAEGSKPERDVYVTEEGGRHISYEYAGRRVAGQILNVDHEGSVLAVSCGGLPQHSNEAGVLRVLWEEDAVPGVGRKASIARLQHGDVVAGSNIWGCSFLVEVLRAETAGTAVAPVTSLVVQRISPLQVFHDLYINFELTGTPERRLTSEPWEYNISAPFMGFNIDEDGNIGTPNIDVGPIRCQDCYIKLQPRVKFYLQTSSLGEVKEIGMEISGDLSLAANLMRIPPTDPHPPNSNEWKRVLEMKGSDLVQAAGYAASLAGLPLFSGLEYALDLDLRPVLSMDYLLEVDPDADLDGTVSIGATTGPRGNTFKASWDPVQGLQMDVSTDVVPSVDFSGLTLPRNLTLGMRSCAELQLTSYDSLVTKVSTCPEVTAFIDIPGPGMGLQLPASVEATRGDDAVMCLEFVKFATNIDLDSAWDYAYAKACWSDRCVSTTPLAFASETVEWTDGALCMDVVEAALQDVPVYLTVKESNNIWSDPRYSEPYPLLAGTQCPDVVAGCTLDVDLMPAAGAGVGKRAELVVKYSVRPKQRRASEPEEHSCNGLAVGVGLGARGGFGGFSLPETFLTSGGPVVEPAQTPSLRQAEPVILCAEVGAEALMAARSPSAPAPGRGSAEEGAEAPTAGTSTSPSASAVGSGSADEGEVVASVGWASVPCWPVLLACVGRALLP